MIQTRLTMMETESKRSIFVRTSMEQPQDLSWRKRIGREFQLTHSQAAADCWVGTGLESSSAKSRKATHGAVCASRIITWDQKTRAKSTQQCSSEEERNVSDQSVTWKWDSSSGKKKENTWMWRMWAMFVTTVSQAWMTSQLTIKQSTVLTGLILLDLNCVQACRIQE